MLHKRLTEPDNSNQAQLQMHTHYSVKNVVETVAIGEVNRNWQEHDW